MADRDARAKLRVYHTIYRLNLSFANIVAHCRSLRESGILQPKYARLYQSFAQELQAEINQNLTNILESAESRDRGRFGKARQAREKELRDPDDVFLHAEARRKELAAGGGKDRKKMGASRAVKRTAPRRAAS